MKGFRLTMKCRSMNLIMNEAWTVKNGRSSFHVAGVSRGEAGDSVELNEECIIT